MRVDFEKHVLSVKWSEYSHPCMQDQSLIPGLLLQMVYGNTEQHLKAAEELWNIAAHQGCVGPSSVPTAGFLIEILESQAPAVQCENLDTLYQFSNCFSGEGWGAELRKLFLDAHPLFRRLSRSSDEHVSDFSEMIIENIETNE